MIEIIENENDFLILIIIVFCTSFVLSFVIFRLLTYIFLVLLMKIFRIENDKFDEEPSINNYKAHLLAIQEIQKENKLL